VLKGLFAAGCGFCVAGFVLFAVDGARGNSITVPQIASIPLSKVNWNPTNLPAYDPMTFTKFDPSLGTLDAIDITIEYSTADTISMTFTSASTITVSSTLRHIQLTRPDTTTIDDASITNVSQMMTYSGPTYPNAVAFPTVNSDVTLPLLQLSTAGDLSLFTGTTASDPISLSAFAFAHSSYSSTSGNGMGSALTQMGLNVTLDYEYTPSVVSPVAVPLPTSAVSTLVLLGALTAFRRWRRGRFSTSL